MSTTCGAMLYNYNEVKTSKYHIVCVYVCVCVCVGARAPMYVYVFWPKLPSMKFASMWRRIALRCEMYFL